MSMTQYDDSLMGPYHISVGGVVIHPALGGVCCETLNPGLSCSLGAGPANSQAVRENKVFRHGAFPWGRKFNFPGPSLCSKKP